MARPGIMLYFDILDPIRVLPDADKGRLLVAMLEYGKNGTVPEFEGMLELAWGFVKPKIDKDSEEYNRTVLKRQYATFCRDRKKKGEPDISFEEWLMTVNNQSYQVISHDNTWYTPPHEKASGYGYLNAPPWKNPLPNVWDCYRIILRWA